MTKKNFKDNPALAFIGNPPETEVKGLPGADTNPTLTEPLKDVSGQKYYRINLKLKAEYKEYLDEVSWRNRKSITQYINDLIAADKERI
jgi:hypothetical protein